MTLAALKPGARVTPVTLADLTQGRPILVLTPHPDDESLGCGGLIAGCVAAGIVVHVALLTDGAGSHAGSRSHPPPKLAVVRSGELVRALAQLGVPAGNFHPLGWPDAGAPRRGPGFERARDQVIGLIRATGAGSIFASWAGDPHCDHEAAARIADAAAMSTGIRHFAYPVWGRLRPGRAPIGPAARLDVTRYLPAKRRAVHCHRSQLGQVVKDAPAAFRLPRALLASCLTRSEIFFEQYAP